MCGLVVETEAAKRNHEKSCRGVQAADDSRRACEKCGRELSKSNIARHSMACTVGEARGAPGERCDPKIRGSHKKTDRNGAPGVGK